MSRAVNALNAAWGWTGVRFAEVVAHSLMGHLVVVDADDGYHYVDPDLGNVVPLGDETAAKEHMDKRETQVLWRANTLVDAAVKRLGPVAMGEVYSLTPQALIAGDYAPENLIRVDLIDLIFTTGDIARQVRDLPDGAPVQLKVCP
ncbi:hypothetical protein WSK_3199 [Novosphingobium sp. Rr 2-17]|uniref:hypothetical protein n=1 Tax=Novosphingobium sp. Rr 2-17 TaxID=555793 RepID=UPI000269857C|nr:hypothetical protein [Novosphingobium sp. Rr 2-17]EIZ78224.1 hypothetical protein WSK_3199 [Novosphingobium sp. Rr 2-17]